MISRFRAAFLGLFVGFVGVAGAGTNDVQINLGPTYPQTIELQDGTNTLSLVIAAQSVLQISNIVVISEDAFSDIVGYTYSFFEDFVFQLEGLTNSLSVASVVQSAEVVDAIRYILDHDDYYHLSSETRADLLQLYDSGYFVHSLISSSYDDALDLLRSAQSVKDYYLDFVYSPANFETYPVLVYADMTLSPASDVSGGCDCAEMLGYIYQVLQSIDARVALSNTNLIEIRLLLQEYLSSMASDLSDIKDLLTEWYNWWYSFTDDFYNSGFFSWVNLAYNNEGFLKTIYDQIHLAGGGSVGGDRAFANAIRAFYMAWAYRDTLAITNVTDQSGPVPLLVEVSNPVSNDWPLAWAVTNFVDYATGEPIPLLVVEDMATSGFSNMEHRADSLTISDSDITPWERFPTGIDWEEIKRKADFSDFQVDDRPGRIKVVDGYDFSWSWGSESDSHLVDYGYWDLSSDESGFFRYVHDFFKALWYFVVGIFPCIFLFWWAFVFGVRATYFGYALLTGRDTARAFARLGALRGFLGDAS